MQEQLETYPIDFFDQTSENTKIKNYAFDPDGRIAYVLMEQKGKKRLRALANCKVHDLTNDLKEEDL